MSLSLNGLNCVQMCVYRDHPVFLMFMQLAVISIFKSYPTVGDVALYLAFIPVWSHLHRCELEKKFLVVINILLHFYSVVFFSLLVLCFVTNTCRSIANMWKILIKNDFSLWYVQAALLSFSISKMFSNTVESLSWSIFVADSYIDVMTEQSDMKKISSKAPPGAPLFRSWAPAYLEELMEPYQPSRPLRSKNACLKLLSSVCLTPAVLRNIFLVACVLLACSALFPVLWHLWIYAGSANSNFYYAITLLFNVAQVWPAVRRRQMILESLLLLQVDK